MDSLQNTQELQRPAEPAFVDRPFLGGAEPVFFRKSEPGCSVFSKIAEKSGRRAGVEVLYTVPRKIRIGKKVTSLRLETEFWDALSTIARDQKCEMVDVLADIRRVYGLRSFTAQVRKACLDYFRQQA
jgi:predicted DNA-binding ribbon-helix-helix protein